MYPMKHIILIIITLFFWACSKQPEDPTTGTIEGNVYDYTNGLVVPMAHVETVPPTSAVISDTATGLFSIEHVDPGVYQIMATKFGYDSSKVSVSVVAGQTTRADVFLRPDSLPADTSKYIYP